MAKKRRLEEILAQREKAKQNTSNSRNVRQISTGLPTTRQQMVMPRRTATEVQALAQSLYNRRSDMTAEQQKVASVAQNYTPIKQNGLAPSNEDKNKAIVQKAVSNYNPNFRQTGVVSKQEVNKDKFLDRVKNEKDPKTQQKMLQQYNSLFHEDKNINQIRKEVKDAETVNKINNGTTAEKVFNTAKFLGQGMAEGAIGAISDINLALSSINGRDKLYGGYKEIEKMNETSKSYQQSLQNVDNKLIKFGGQVTNTVGAMLPSIGMNLIAPGTGNIMAGVSAGSSAYLETLNEGQDNKGKAMLTGVLKGTLAGTIEKLIGGNKIGTGALDDIAVKNIAKVKSQLAQKLLSKGYEVVGEVGEENLENFAGYLIDMAVNNKKVTVEDAVRDLIDTTGTTAGATLLLSALGLGGGTFNDVQIETNKNNQIKNSGLTENQQQKLTEVAEKYDLSQADIQNLIDNTKNGKYDQKQGTTIENKAISEQGQQVIQQEGKIDEKAISQQVEQELKNTNYKREESVKRAFESAKKYNIDTKSDTFREKIRIADERGVDLVYDASVFGNNTNQNAVWKIKRDENGKIVSREIVFNPNAKGDMTLEQVWTHEITHDMEGNGKYKTMRNELLDYLKTKPEYEKAFNDLKAIYAKVYAEENLTEQEFNELIEDEVVADMLGSKLGDTEFLKSLNKEKRSLGKRIYDWVVDRLNKLNKKKGYTNEKLFWQDIKNKFENAYKEDFVDSDSKNKLSVDTNAKTNPKQFSSKEMSKRLDEIKKYRDSLRKQLFELRQERNDIIETISNYSIFKKYPELEDINKRMDDNTNLSKQLYAEQKEIESKIEEIKEQEKKERIAREEAEATPFKLAQNKIIQETNPMLDDYHTGIRSVGDIRTWEEAMSDAEKDEDGYAWGDFTKEDAERALKNNSITIYSSYPIKNGVFVSTSYIQAQQYAGGPGGKVYSKTIKPERVAWINVDEGQYASVKPSDIKFSLSQETKANLEAKIDRYSRLVEQMQKEGRDSDEWSIYANEILRLEDQLEGKRYSRESTGAWNDFKNKYAKNEGEGKTIQDITLQPKKISEVFKPKEKVSEIEEKQFTPSKKAQDYEKRQKNSFKKKMSDLLGVSRYNRNNKAVFNDAIEELQKDFNNNSKISEKKKNEVFENMYQKLVKEDTAFYNDNKEIKDTIRLTPLYVSDKTKADITDYNDFKRNAFGSVKLSNDKSNVPVDTFYKELTYMNPELFPDTITSTGDQLKRIVEVAKSIRKSERNISAYNDETMSKEYKRWAKYEFDKIVAELEGEFRNIQKYNAEKEKEFISKNEPYVKPEVAEIKFIYENRAQLRKDIEKQEKILLLTEREKAVVDRLLKDEMDIEEIQDGLNKNGIIKSYYARQQLTYLDEAVKQYKQYKKQQLKETSDVLTKNAKEWSDKKLGIQYARETATRNIRDIMSKEDAERVNKEIFEPILRNTSEQTRFINNYVDIIENLDLDKKEKYEWHDADGKEIKIDEATLAQLVIEKKIDNDYLKEVGADVEKINKVAKTFSKILEETVNKMDEIYIEFGYAPVEKRKNYFPHFIENKADTFMSKFANALGVRVNPDNLPTDIAGRTETFKPGRAFDRNILRRTTDKTDYNALKALDMYIQGASDIIYHTEDIQKLRAFNESIRDKFRDSEIDKKIEEINENPELTVEERAEKIKEIKENVKTPLGNLVTWLDEYTNALANKKSSADRQLEKDLNRQIYTTMQDLEGRIASNLIGGNLSVSLTNFSPLAQAMGTTKIGDILIGMIQTTQNTIKEMQNNGDNFVSESDFLTSRRGTGQAQKQTAKQNVSNFLGIPMEVVDNFTSESIVRAKYRENIKKGMEHAEALYKADTYARNLMGDRSKGALPTLFNRKNPVAKLMTSFQVEPNNIISNYFKDMPADAETKSQLAGNIVKLSVASWAFNTILKSIRGGSDVIPNPIGIISKLVGLAISNLDDDEENDKDVQEVLIEIAGDILGSIPFGTSIATIATALGVEGLEDTGKFMVSNALPSASKVKNLFDKDVAPEYKKKIALEELTKPLIYLGLPTAGAQVAKTAKGISAYIQGGSYTYDTKGNKKMQFPIEQNVGNAIKAGLFGKYSLEGGKTYVESEFKSLNGEETKVYEESNVDFYELQDYFSYSKQEGIKKEDKINYVSSMNISDSDKWNLYKHNILSSTERDDGTSELSDAEYIIKNNMATEKEYMKLYSNAVKNKVEFPSTETLKELKQEKLSLKTYLDYKTEAKKETIAKRRRKQDENASLTDSEQCQILIDSNYTDKEKKTIYSNYIAKNDKTYLYLEKLTGNKVNINQYLDYKTAEIKGIDDPKSIVKGKTKSGSKKANLQKNLRESNFSEVEALYIYGTQNSLNSTQRVQITNYINKAKQAGRLTASEEKDLYKKLKSVEELENGQIRWK